MDLEHYEQPGAYWVREDLYTCGKCKQRTATVCGKPCAGCVLQAEAWDFLNLIAALPVGVDALWDEVRWRAETLIMRRMEIDS